MKRITSLFLCLVMMLSLMATGAAPEAAPAADAAKPAVTETAPTPAQTSHEPTAEPAVPSTEPTAPVTPAVPSTEPTEVPTPAPEAALFDRLMALQTYDELNAALKALTAEEIASLLPEQQEALKVQNHDLLMKKLLAIGTTDAQADALNNLSAEAEQMLTEADWAALDQRYDALYAAERAHEVVVPFTYPTVNFSKVAPLGAPVEGPQPLFATLELPNDPAVDNGLELSKTLTYDDQNGYQLRLEAWATGDEIKVKKEVPCDIVLILDQSGSMNHYMDGTKPDDDDDEDGDKPTQKFEYKPVYSGELDQKKTYYLDDQGSTKVEWKKSQYGYEAGWYKNGNFGLKGKNLRHPKTGPDDTNLDHYQFYEKVPVGSGGGTASGKEVRLDVLKQVVQQFADDVHKRAVDNNVNHRIAVVGFASGDKNKEESSSYFTNTELFIGADQYNYKSGGEGSTKNAVASTQYANAFQDMKTQAGYDNVIASKNNLSASGATQPKYGFEMANGIFEANQLNPGEERQRIVIFLTDGAPGKNGYDGNAATPTVTNASTTKKAYGATVYSVGIFQGADATATGVGKNHSQRNENQFMHNTSSNNGKVPAAGQKSYYLSAADSATLQNIFKQIAGEIQGGSNSKLGAEAVLRDVITPYFEMKVPEGGTADQQVKLYTAPVQSVDANGNITWGADVKAAAGITAAVNVDRTIDVTGFAYNDNWCGKDASGKPRGQKLVVVIPIEPTPGFLGGNNVPTNEPESAIYPNKESKEPVEKFEVPAANVPIKPITITAPDYNVHLNGGVAAEVIKKDVIVKCGGVSINPNSPTEGLQDWQHAFVTLTGSNTAKDGYSNLTADEQYIVSLTVAPNSNAAVPSVGPAATEKTGTATGHIKVFKPEITFKDSVINPGTTPDYNTENLKELVWKHNDTLSKNVTMHDTEPKLTYEYTHATTGEALLGALNQETPVKVTVKIGDTDVTQYVTFYRQKDAKCPGTCDLHDKGIDDKISVNATDTNRVNFIVHMGTFDLKITKIVNGRPTYDAQQTFLFHVTGPNGYSQDVILLGNADGTGSEGSVTLKNLPVGSYTVTEDTGWSWRYTCTSGAEVNITENNLTNGTAEAKFTNEYSEDHWLGDNAYADNMFAEKSATTK